MTTLSNRLRGWLGRDRGARVRVHILLRGRIGEGWYDIDRDVALPAGTTLGELVTEGDKLGIPLREALDRSPHLSQTLMLNGARCPIADHRDRILADGDEIYLLAPLAGG